MTLRCQTWSQIHLYLKVFKYFFLSIWHFGIKSTQVIVFKHFPKVFDFSNYFQILSQTHCQYQHFCFKITCNACQTDYPVPSPNSANYWWRHLTAGVPMALPVTRTFVCSVPEDWITPDWDVSQNPLSSLIRLQAGMCYSSLLADFEVELLHFVTRP